MLLWTAVLQDKLSHVQELVAVSGFLCRGRSSRGGRALGSGADKVHQHGKVMLGLSHDCGPWRLPDRKTCESCAVCVYACECICARVCVRVRVSLVTEEAASCGVVGLSEF